MAYPRRINKGELSKKIRGRGWLLDYSRYFALIFVIIFVVIYRLWMFSML